MKRWRYIIPVVTILVACGSLEIKREVVGDTFVSNYPKMAVKVGGAFELAESSERQLSAPLSNGSTNIRSFQYLFVEKRSQNAILIEIQRLNEGRFHPDFNQGLFIPLRSGADGQQHDRYHYVIFAGVDGGGTCRLIKRYGKTSGYERNTLQTVQYVQHIRPKLGTCDQWQNPSALTPQQHAFLARFEADSERDVRFVEF